jgi:hypothetical protein
VENEQETGLPAWTQIFIQKVFWNLCHAGTNVWTCLEIMWRNKLKVSFILVCVFRKLEYNFHFFFSSVPYFWKFPYTNLDFFLTVYYVCHNVNVSRVSLLVLAHDSCPLFYNYKVVTSPESRDWTYYFCDISKKYSVFPVLAMH